MARRDWSKLQAEYEQAFNESGITIKQWCDKKRINYNTARRYLKVITKSDQSEETSPNLRTPTQDTPKKKPAKPSNGDQKGVGKRGEKQENTKSSSSSAQSDQLNCAKSSDQSDHSGRSTQNPQRNHLGHFMPNNTICQKHGAYARRLGDLDAIFDASKTVIDDEIEMCRARTMIAMTKYGEIESELQSEELGVVERVKLYELWKETDIAIDRNVARIESLLKTKANVRKSELESERLASEQAGLGTAIADIVAEVQAMDSNGFVVH
ncbi:hypothetical protein ETS23_21005 [Vibrio parahaemolyticus]|nr:hypothetical protein [Vibrio parahaemolyticus]